jgi:plastocyanin
VLLSVKPNAATATALAAAAGIMAVAAFVASRKQVTGAALGGFVGAAAGIAMLAGGIAIAVIGPPEEEVPALHAALAAPEGAITEGFSTDALAFEAGRPVELEFTNDDATGHNIWILDGPDDAASPLFQGADVPGPGETVYRIPPMAPGEYFFFCELHPGTAMEGTLTVSEGGPGGVEIVAENTAFGTEEITLPADIPASLTLDNRDTTAHNLSIYEDDSASGDPLFTFEAFPGPDTKRFDVPPIPEGDYYFRCDIHPSMDGTVVVAPPPPPPGEAGGGEGGGASPPPGGGG